MRKPLLTGTVLIALLATSGYTSEFQEDYMLYKQTCMVCHEMRFHLWPRSFKSWQLTVENMRSYAYGDNAFTGEEGERIARFLGNYAGEGTIIVPEGETTSSVSVAYVEMETVDTLASEVSEPELVETVVVASVEQELPEPELPEPEPVEPEVSEPEAIAAVAAAQPAKPKMVIPLRKRIWNPSRNALRGARVSGFAAVVCLLGLLLSGFKRRSLKQRFRKIHVSLAFGLFVTLAIHGVIYIAEYGTPGVMWYWFGLVGFVALIITEVQGIMRKRFRKGLLISHIIGGCTGFALSVLHWIWAWL